VSRIPADLREGVWRSLYEDAGRLDWEHLSSQSKSQQYARWLDDPHIGGILTRFMDRDQARVYIKDSPMKEYARALAGEGPGAKFTINREAAPERIVQAALGAGWTVVRGSVGIKPMHCWARLGDRRRYLCWARSDHFGDLVWAALNQVVDNPESDPLIVIRESAASPTSVGTRKRHQSIADRCGVALRYVAPVTA
jgi:hypothetical protein